MGMNEKLAELRKAKGLTQKELAETLHISRQAISRWEVGTAAPSLDNLARLSEIYGIPLDELAHSGTNQPVGPKNESAASVAGGRKKAARFRALALASCLFLAGVLITVISLKAYHSYRMRKLSEGSMVILNINGNRQPGYITSDDPSKFQDENGEINVPLAPYDPDKPFAYIEKPDGTYEEVHPLSPIIPELPPDN